MIHLRPTAELAPRVLLPGDPGRAMALAQHLLDGPLMFNHHRGLWGYTGPAADGELLTIQSTGMGGPSAAIVLEELAVMGVTRAIRVGTCGAIVSDLALGDLLVIEAALAADGTSTALGAETQVQPDQALTARLAPGSPMARRGVVATTDLFYDTDESRASDWRAAGAVAVEMEAAALMQVGRRRGIAVAAILAVSDTIAPDGARARIDEDELLRVAHTMGDVAAAALMAADDTAPLA